MEVQPRTPEFSKAAWVSPKAEANGADSEAVASMADSEAEVIVTTVETAVMADIIAVAAAAAAAEAGLISTLEAQWPPWKLEPVRPA